MERVASAACRVAITAAALGMVAPTAAAMDTGATTAGAVGTVASTAGAVGMVATTAGAVGTVAPTAGAVSMVAPTAGAAGMVATTAVSAGSKLKEHFESEKVSREDLDEALHLLHGELFNCWSEKLYHSVIHEISEDKFDEFVLSLRDILSLEEDMCPTLEKIKGLNETDFIVYPLKRQQNEFKSKYGYLVIIRNSNNTLSCAYAIHKLKLKLADHVEQITTPKYFLGIIKTGEEVKEVHREVKFSEKNISRITEIYMKYKALEALQMAGIIDQITYEI